MADAPLVRWNQGYGSAASQERADTGLFMEKEFGTLTRPAMIN